MRPLASVRTRVVFWVITLLLPWAAWQLTSAARPWFHNSGIGIFFTIAAVISAAAGGMSMAVVAAVLNVAALNWFSSLNRPGGPIIGDVLWSLLLIILVLMVGYTREKWSAAEMLAGHLSTDLARLRDELDSQRTDLKRFHDLSVSLSSILDLQRLLQDVLAAIAALQKTDLAMLLLLPESGRNLEVRASAGFSEEQIKLFGELPSSFFSPLRRLMIDDIESPGTYFPFVDAAVQIGFRALFSTPIVTARGEPLGVVVTFFRQPYSPPERQCRLVELYVRQAANALENARLYRDSLDRLAAERRRTAVLRSLADASVQINSVSSLDSMLQTITEQARRIIGAEQAFTTLLPRDDRRHSITCTAATDGQAALQFPPERSEIFMLACSLNKPVRITASTGEKQPWGSMLKADYAASAGWLAAPLLTRDGRNLGLIQLSRKIEGEFVEDDEAILVQLAHMASVAIDNVHLYREAQEQVSRTRRAQEALERSKETMALAQRSVGIGIWEWDLQSGDLTWSEEICRLHRIEPERFDGKYESWMQSVHPEDRRQVHRAISEAMARGGEYTVEYRVAAPDNNVRWLEARGQIITLGSTPVRMLGVAMDVTSRKLAEEALRRSEEVAATGRLAASIAHEINNPLATVTNVLYILHTNPDLPEKAREYVKTAESELARVAHITRQTLAFYREVPAPVQTSIPDLLDEVVSVFGRKLNERKIAIQRRFADVSTVRAFPGELRQVFSNLVLNALESMKAPGSIALRVHESMDRNGRAGIRITVADTGAGITPDNLPRIFEPFFTTKQAKGTGLGLWVSQGIVQKHRGTIRVRSRSGEEAHGTCFMVFLPFEVAEANKISDGSDGEEQKMSSQDAATRTTAASATDLSVA
ncbi:MAG TPA: ATP-binding protein [Candidatus Angelobacter sp.]|nr:ATP-binding protein [Candidatus Angelobacter sp.]